MKIKALGSFISGRYSATRGEITDVPQYVADKLIACGVAEPAQTGGKGSGDKTTDGAKKSTAAGKSAAKPVGKK